MMYATKEEVECPAAATSRQHEGTAWCGAPIGVRVGLSYT